MATKTNPLEKAYIRKQTQKFFAGKTGSKRKNHTKNPVPSIQARMRASSGMKTGRQTKPQAMPIPAILDSTLEDTNEETSADSDLL